MVYKRYIKRGGKTFGPYYYESYRDEAGRVRTRFISGPEIYTKKSSATITENNKEFNWNVLIFLFGIFLLIGVVVISFNYLPDEITSVKSDLNKKMSVISDNVLSFITGLTTEGSESDEGSKDLSDVEGESGSEINSGESGEDVLDSVSDEDDSNDAVGSDTEAVDRSGERRV